MIFKRITRDNPEKVFVVFKNSHSTSSLTNGQAVMLDYASEADGVAITKPAASKSGFQIVGIAAMTIAHGSYGLIQVYGYHSAVRVRTLTSTGHAYHESLEAVAAGTMLAGALTAVFCLEGISTAGTFTLHPNAIALAAQASYTTKAIAAFIKNLG